MPRLIQTQLISTIFVIVFAKRLPNNLVPIEYVLEIITNLGDGNDTFSFKGSVLIHVSYRTCFKIFLFCTNNDIFHSVSLTLLFRLNSNNPNLKFIILYYNSARWPHKYCSNKHKNGLLFTTVFQKQYSLV